MLDIPEIFQAVLIQSETDLIEILGRHPASLNETIGCGIKPIHYSVSWPRGLVLLLEAGADFRENDARNCTVLFYACLSGCTESINLLLDLDRGAGGVWNYNVHLQHAINIQDQTTRQRFVSALVNGRRRLQDIAQLLLPREELTRLQLDGNRILDGKTADVISALQHRKILVPPDIMPGGYSSSRPVYHLSQIDTQWATIFHEAGFHDIEETDNEGMTGFWAQVAHLIAPEHLVRRLEILEWFISQGAGRFCLHPIAGGPALHCFGASIGNYIFHTFRVWRIHRAEFPSAEDDRPNLFVNLTSRHVKFLKGILTEEFADGCVCSCTTSGCRVITSTLSSPAEWIWNSWALRPIPIAPCQQALHDTWLYLAKFLESEQRRCPWLVSEFIRVVTFQRLGLTHTCHVDYHGFYSFMTPEPYIGEEEVGEIRNEERFLIQQMEELVRDFEEKYAASEGKLGEFLDGYWRSRMDEILGNIDDVDEEMVSGMRDIGIVIE